MGLAAVRRLAVPARVTRETAWLLPVIAPVATFGAVALVVAAWDFAASPDAGVVGGVAALAVAATLAEAFPVPIEGVPLGATSLANVFIVAAAVLYGWSAGVLVAFVAMGVVEAVVRRPPPARIVYNSALYVAGALAAGAAVAVVDAGGLARFPVDAIVGSAAFYVANIGLLTLVVARSGREPSLALGARYVRWTILPFLIMASVTVTLVLLWTRSPLLAAPLLGPLVAVALYQRSMHTALEAMRLARTDPLTGLGNARDFRERLEKEFDAAYPHGRPLTVSVLDVDNFKSVNDAYGHTVGDRVLCAVAARLRQDGEAFRIGGDEFALLLPGVDEPDGLAIAHTVVERAMSGAESAGPPSTVSAGVASYPRHALEPSELVRLADAALLRAKGEGKSRVASYSAQLHEVDELRRIADQPGRTARLRAAATLARAVDERDAYTGRHSFAVGELAALVATRMGLEPTVVELLRLAGRLHDVGKLAIPEEILRKRGPLTDSERKQLERHAQIGFRMLESLSVEPVATWVLHHHECWDGSGYPGGLAGDQIPLGARIIFAADAFDAMTTDRVYRAGIPRERALAELERCAGSQFDEDVVVALRSVVTAMRAVAAPTVKAT